ncbi:hypothetical protein TNIN_191221, partial [Trichonephila inaurata madagascariensis]
LRGVEKPTRKLIQRFGVMRRRPTMRKTVILKSRMSYIDSPKLQNSVFKQLAKSKVTIHGDLWYEGKAVKPYEGRDPLSSSVDAAW